MQKIISLNAHLQGIKQWKTCFALIFKLLCDAFKASCSRQTPLNAASHSLGLRLSLCEAFELEEDVSGRW
jgi:hypothetical protein